MWRTALGLDTSSAEPWAYGTLGMLNLLSLWWLEASGESAQQLAERMADLYRDLPTTFGTPTMSPHCADETKYGIVAQVVKHFEDVKAKGGKVAGQPIRDLVTVNGVRVTCEDGSWGLVRASSNKPELVVVVESPVSEQRMRDMFEAMDSVLRTHPEVGEYNQKI